jgi:hypothetical protein
MKFDPATVPAVVPRVGPWAVASLFTVTDCFIAKSVASWTSMATQGHSRSRFAVTRAKIAAQ